MCEYNLCLASSLDSVAVTTASESIQLNPAHSHTSLLIVNTSATAVVYALLGASGVTVSPSTGVAIQPGSSLNFPLVLSQTPYLALIGSAAGTVIAWQLRPASSKNGQPVMGCPFLVHSSENFALGRVATAQVRPEYLPFLAAR